MCVWRLEFQLLPDDDHNNTIIFSVYPKTLHGENHTKNLNFFFGSRGRKGTKKEKRLIPILRIR